MLEKCKAIFVSFGKKNNDKCLNNIDIILEMCNLIISAFQLDYAACIFKDDKIIATSQEERFTRKKHDQISTIDAKKII